MMGPHSMNVANLGAIETLITNAHAKVMHIGLIANLQYVLIGRSDKTYISEQHEPTNTFLIHDSLFNYQSKLAKISRGHAKS